MVKRLFSYAWFALLLSASAVAATSIDALKSFVNDALTIRADFDQTVRDASGRTTQQSSGNMQFSRPGKFRWEYEKPYQQLVVGDGHKLWIYDADLNQVTVRTLDEAIGSSPAALLAGDQAIEKNFVLKDIGANDGLAWLEATPKSKETAFERVLMGFDGNALAVMELKDNFGQVTVIRFRDLQKNPKFAADAFKFTPPKGADVIGQ